MKLRIVAGAAVAAAALALPAVAHAATYAPVSASDDAYTEGSTSEPANAGIDITNLRGYRTDTQLTVATKFRNLKSVPYSRRIVVLIDPTEEGNARGRLAEFRTGPKGTINVAFYAFNFTSETPDLKQVSCAGLRASASAATDKLTFVIPASCYPGAKSDGAIVIDQAASYTAETWTPGPLTFDESSQPDQSDGTSATWDWSGNLSGGSPRGMRLLF